MNEYSHGNDQPKYYSSESRNDGRPDGHSNDPSNDQPTSNSYQESSSLKDRFKEQFKSSLNETKDQVTGFMMGMIDRRLDQFSSGIEVILEFVDAKIDELSKKIEDVDKIKHKLQEHIRAHEQAQRTASEDFEKQLKQRETQLQESHKIALIELEAKLTASQNTLSKREAEFETSYRTTLSAHREELTRRDTELGTYQELYTDDLEHLDHLKKMIKLVRETPELMTRLQVSEGFSLPELLQVLTIKLSNEAYIRKLLDFYTDQCFERQRPCKPQEEALIDWAIELRNLASDSDEWTRSVVELGVMTTDHEVTADLNSGRIQEVYLRGVEQDKRMPSAVRIG